RVLALVVRDEEVEEAHFGQRVQIITNQTPFYGESGGQQGDTGVLRTGSTVVQILDVQKPLPDFYVHYGLVQEGLLTLGDDVHLTVDHGRRTRLRANHSATHLLHKAL